MMQSSFYLQISIKEQGFQHAPAGKRPPGKEWTCAGFKTSVRFSGARD
jgi:hypothetical protein